MTEAQEQPEESDQLKEEVETLKRQRDEYLAGWQRARADFLNYKKEEMERIEKLMESARETFVYKLLPLLDNFEIVEKNLSDTAKATEDGKAVLQLKKELENFFRTQGVESITTLGKKFDPVFDEAVQEVEKQGVEQGIVIEEVQKGYTILGRLLRPAKVKVAK